MSAAGSGAPPAAQWSIGQIALCTNDNWRCPEQVRAPKKGDLRRVVGLVPTRGVIYLALERCDGLWGAQAFAIVAPDISPCDALFAASFRASMRVYCQRRGVGR